jgi:endogenous inhibitor of DNA gyrase (YacG/DUF329 family)
VAVPNLPQACGFGRGRRFSFLQRALQIADLGNWASDKYVFSEPVIDESTPDDSERPSDRHDDERKSR